MHFEDNKTYHIYNRSNETVFYNKDNYLYFLKKVNQLIFPYADILAWCLMPNHFHFLLAAKPRGCELINERHRPTVQYLSKNIGTLLSSYTRAINKAYKRKGKLFAHNTEAKCLNDESNNENFLINCFHYIHQNPLRTGLCKKSENWQYSSYRDYAGLRNGKLVNKELAFEMMNIDKDDFILQPKALIDENMVQGLF